MTHPVSTFCCCAPTGSGKTLAAFHVGDQRPRASTLQATSFRDEVSVLYVSPLKALANDISPESRGAAPRPSAMSGAESGIDLSRIRAPGLLATGDNVRASRAHCDAPAASAYSRHHTRVAVSSC